MDNKNNETSLGKDVSELGVYTLGSDEEIKNASVDEEMINKVLAAKKASVGNAIDVSELEKTAGFDDSGMYAGTMGVRGSVQSPYPSPFLTLSDLKIPNSATEIFQWCKYTFMFDPLISGAINALSTFPVTEISLEDKNTEKSENGDKTKDSDTLKLYNRVLFENLNIYKILVDIGIDYWLFGNCFIFGELYTNPNTKQIEWKRITRLAPDKMTIDYNPSTGNKTYRWTVPERIKQIVLNKKPFEEYERIPDAIKIAVRERKTIVLNPENIYHFSRPSNSTGNDTGWGTPVVANVLKLIMYRNVLRQAQEAIAREHIVPFRAFYLNPSQNANPNTDWANVAKNFAAELMKSVRDPNYKSVSPFPIGMVEAGGNGRALMLTSEIEQVQNEILAGMNVPREFIFGGVGYSGGSIALKILENNFATYRLFLTDFIKNFLIKGMAKARGEWLSEKDDENLITVRFSDLKMMDDTQKKQMVINLNQAGKVSDDHLWQELGINPEKMRKMLKDEQVSRVKNELEMQKEQYKASLDLKVYQAKLFEEYAKKYPDIFGEQNPDMTNPEIQQDQQGDTQQPQQAEEQQPVAEGNAQDNVEQENPIQLSSDELNVANQIKNLNKNEQAIVFNKLPKQIAQKIMAYLEAEKNAQKQEDKTKTDMTPLPLQKPPRREQLNG